MKIKTIIRKLLLIKIKLHLTEKQGTPEEGWRIQWPKRYEKNNEDEDNRP